MFGKDRIILFAVVCAGCALLFSGACNQGGKKVGHSEGETETDTGEESGKVRSNLPSHLSTVQVKSVDPPDDVEAAGAMETVIAFNNIGAFVECEKTIPGIDQFVGTVVVQFGVDGDGNLAGEPLIVLATSSEQGELEECILSAFNEIDLTSVSLGGPRTFHLILKYSK